MRLMKSRLASFAVLLSLAACNTDVLSTKPETDAQLPTPAPAPAPDPAPQPAPAPVVTPTPEPAPAPAPEPAPAPAPTPVPPPDLQGPIPTDRTDTRVPFTDKLVRNLGNNGTMTLKTGQTLTVVLNSNTSEGFDWLMEPVPAGVTLIGDYYRETAPTPGGVNIGGTRYFLFRAEAPGKHQVRIRHTNGTDTRATKTFFIDVSAP